MNVRDRAKMPKVEKVDKEQHRKNMYALCDGDKRQKEIFDYIFAMEDHLEGGGHIVVKSENELIITEDKPYDYVGFKLVVKKEYKEDDLFCYELVSKDK